MKEKAIPLWALRGFDLPSVRVDMDWGGQWFCATCGSRCERYIYKNISMIVGPGRRWPDILHTIGKLVLHERVVDTLKSEQFTGYVPHPVNIREIKGKTLSKMPPPKYYLFEITGRLDVDVGQLDDIGGSVCPTCLGRVLNHDSPYWPNPKEIVPIEETWDGSDFCKFGNWGTGRKLCSRRFIDLAHKHKWTNFIFGEDVPGIGLWERPQKGINGLSYHRSDWYERALERYEEKMRTADEKSLD